MEEADEKSLSEYGYKSVKDVKIICKLCKIEMMPDKMFPHFKEAHKELFDKWLALETKRRDKYHEVDVEFLEPMMKIMQHVFEKREV
jgi:hypothetical protein